MSTESFTVGELLDALRAQAVSRLQVAKPNTDLRIVAMTGSGTVSAAQIKGNLSWWKGTAKSGPFALCYAVAAQTNGKPVSKYQAAGARWGWANSYSTGAKDVALKSRTLNNGSSILKAGSVFLSPAYVVFPDEEGAVTQLLKDAYYGWLKITNPVAQPGLADILLKRLTLTPVVTQQEVLGTPPQMTAIDEDLRGNRGETAEILGAVDPGFAGNELMDVGNDDSPEIADALDTIEEISSPRRRFGRRLTAAQNKAIEERAVEVVRAELERRGYVTQDVGATESYDVHAMKDGNTVKVEVKGTTTDGSKVYLTANEVELHRTECPNNALGIVRRIALDTSGDIPVATRGELELTIGWQIDDARLRPVAYAYDTGL